METKLDIMSSMAMRKNQQGETTYIIREAIGFNTLKN
jgi:hypothetical protein